MLCQRASKRHNLVPNGPEIVWLIQHVWTKWTKLTQNDQKKENMRNYSKGRRIEMWPPQKVTPQATLWFQAESWFFNPSKREVIFGSLFLVSPPGSSADCSFLLGQECIFKWDLLVIGLGLWLDIGIRGWILGLDPLLITTPNPHPLWSSLGGG